ncbi:hypothetical protein D0T50_05670 [Bacteroides sp. 214]|uniref:hypothetical protein n=1 Tax=Bacteroides sp. 214 TaxID=2302935 RepID=UPI0013D74DA4|nr:hypothetical protein [Bacteroides sp. 214]NDW12377.1 hypothetical protein [Bacteroides sp. 214]
MGLLNNELHKAAIVAGQIILGLEHLEKQIYSKYDILEHKEDFLFLAYMCRVGIIDRVELKGWPPTLPIVIPLGIFRTREETISTMLIFIITQLKELASSQEDIIAVIDDILEKGEIFYEYDSIIPYDIKNNLLSNTY